MPEGAERVHGLTRDFLAQQKRFADEADAILEFIGDAKLVMHNAPFDLGFLNAELERIERAPDPAGADGGHAGHRTPQVSGRRRRVWMRSASASGSTAPCARSMACPARRRAAHRRLSGAHRRPPAGARPAAGRRPAAVVAPESGPARERTPHPPAPPTEADLGPVAEAAAHAAFVATLKDPIWNG